MMRRSSALSAFFPPANQTENAPHITNTTTRGKKLQGLEKNSHI